MINQKLLDYVKQQSQLGVPRESIKIALIQQGWQQRDVDEAISQVFGQNGVKQEDVTNSKIGDASKNRNAIIALILGLLGLVTWIFPIIGIPVTIIGLVLGVKGLKSLKRIVAIVGIALCTIGLLASILLNAVISIKRMMFVDGMSYQPFPLPITTKTTKSEISSTLEKQAYSNSKNGFKINVPKGWTVDESGKTGAIAHFYNPQADKEFILPSDKEPLLPFNVNISVASGPAQGMDLDSYVKANKDALPKLFPDYKQVEDKSLIVNGIPARLIGGTFTQTVFRFRTELLIAVKNDQAYLVTATVLNRTWDQYKNLIMSSLLTFNLN